MPKLLDGGIYGDISCGIYAPWPKDLSQRGRVPIAKGPEFVEKNVRADKLAMKELIDQGFQSTPVDDNRRPIGGGFDQLKITELLGL